LKASIPGAELEIIDGAGHLPQVERPREFVAALLRFASASLDPDPPKI
jgi:pimeloyl-ACP methyl ester carboxylesterase